MTKHLVVEERLSLKTAADPVTRETLEYLESEGLAVVDIGVDIAISGNQNRPYDDHPSAIAAVQYAEKLETYLRESHLLR